MCYWCMHIINETSVEYQDQGCIVISSIKNDICVHDTQCHTRHILLLLYWLDVAIARFWDYVHMIIHLIGGNELQYIHMY